MKELPYFKFYPGEYSKGDVTDCTMAAQGLFTNICGLYWSKGCDLTLTRVQRKFNTCSTELSELISDGIFIVNDDEISINFLDEQFEQFGELAKKKSRAGKASAKKRKGNTRSTRVQQVVNKEEKIRGDKIKEDIYRKFAHLSLSKEEFESIKATGYTQRRIDDILDSIENYQGNAKYKSLNLTVRAWLKRDKEKVVAVSNVQPKYEPEPLPETWAPMPASLKKLASKIGKA